jgi:triosephosphate isomerase
MKLIVGNWKMNGLRADSRERTEKLAQAAASFAGNKMVLCPPATMVAEVVEWLKTSPLSVGGQDCHAENSGAFTGNVSAEMLKDLGCTHVIVGHSERRALHGETSEMVAAKAKAVHASGMISIICVGETDAERTACKAESIVTDQLKKSIPEGSTAANTVIAYEPVWAIGTGKTASTDDIRQMHALIRAQVGNLQILYGGSVKGSNAQEIMSTPNVDGVLVGGASLKADDFIDIAKAC